MTPAKGHALAAGVVRQAPERLSLKQVVLVGLVLASTQPSDDPGAPHRHPAGARQRFSHSVVARASRRYEENGQDATCAAGFEVPVISGVVSA